MKKMVLVYSMEEVAANKALQLSILGFHPKVKQNRAGFYEVRFNITEREYSLLKADMLKF